RRRRRIHQRAGIGRAHLEQDAEAELAQQRSIERAVQVRQRIAPDDDVDAERRAFAQDGGEALGRAWFALAAAAGEADVVVRLAQFPQAVDAEDEEEPRRAVGGLPLLSALDLGGE